MNDVSYILLTAEFNKNKPFRPADYIHFQLAQMPSTY